MVHPILDIVVNNLGVNTAINGDKLEEVMVGYTRPPLRFSTSSLS